MEGQRVDLAFCVDRWFPVTVENLWKKCTTKEGLESWWSPEDLRTRVTKLEVRSGGAIDFFIQYVPALLIPQARAQFRAAGVPLSFHLRGRFTEVVPHVLLAFHQTLELGKAGAGIEMSTRLEFESADEGSRVKLTAGGAPTPHWSTLGRTNLEEQLERLARVVAP